MIIDYIESTIKEKCPVCREDLNCDLRLDGDRLGSMVSGIRGEVPYVLTYDSKKKIFQTQQDIVGFPSTINVGKLFSINTDGINIQFKFSCRADRKANDIHTYYMYSNALNLFKNVLINFNTINWINDWEYLDVAINGYDKFTFDVSRLGNTTRITHRDYHMFKNTANTLPAPLKLRKLSYNTKEAMLEKLTKYLLLK